MKTGEMSATRIIINLELKSNLLDSVIQKN